MNKVINSKNSVKKHKKLSSALLLHAINKDVEKVRAVLTKGLEISDNHRILERSLNKKMVQDLILDVDKLSQSCKDLLLMYSSKNGFSDLMQELISAGADVFAKDIYGATAFHYAVQHRSNVSIVSELLTKCSIENSIKCDINALDGQGKTPLFYAMLSLGKRHVMASKLIDNGAVY